MLSDAGVRIELNSRVEKIDGAEGAFGVYIGGRRREFDRVIVATGGVSYPATGSTGDGLDFARSYGLSVTELHPSLQFSARTQRQQTWRRSSRSYAKKRVADALRTRKRKILRAGRDAVLSREGITGPLVLTASAHISDFKFSDTTADIDFKPALSREKLDARIRRELSGAKANKHGRLDHAS